MEDNLLTPSVFSLCIDPSTPWPPPDPEREPAAFNNARRLASGNTTTTTALDDKEYVAAFRQRQQADLKRWQKEDEDEYEDEEDGEKEPAGILKPAPGSSWDGVWRNEDGATLADYGVDEDAEGGLGVEEARKFLPGGSSSAYATEGYAGMKQRTARRTNGAANAGNVRVGGPGEDDNDEEVSIAELLRRRRGAGKRTPDNAGAAALDVFSG